MMEGWSVPRCFAGRTVAVLASGPSMSAAVADRVLAARIPTIAVNTTFRLAPWAWMLYAADIDWWQHREHRDALAFAGLKVSIRTKIDPAPPGLLTLWNSGREGFDTDPASLRTGANSGYQAVHIAAQAGAGRILLCGFDMHGGHWHGDHPRGLKVNNSESFVVFLERFGELAPLLKKIGVDVVNCTPDSALRCFRMSTLETEIAASTQPAAYQSALPA